MSETIPADRRTRPLASVIMRCKNSDWVIEQTLASLFSQSFTDFELLVVDSGSEDRTLEIVRNYPCQLIEIEPTAYVPGAVLNMAAARARGELLVFLNSDTVPLTCEALGALIAPLTGADAQPKVAATFARQIPRPEAQTWVRRDYGVAFPATAPAPSWLTFSLPFAAMRKDVWRQRPFYVDSWASEDTEWGQWALASGWQIQYVPAAAAMHSHNYTLSQIYGRRFVEGEADAFIRNEPSSVLNACRRWASSTWKDVRAAAAAADWRGMVASPLRRAVYHWAHLRGQRHGWHRKTHGDTSIATGLEVILKRHDAVKPRAKSRDAAKPMAGATR